MKTICIKSITVWIDSSIFSLMIKYFLAAFTHAARLRMFGFFTLHFISQNSLSVSFLLSLCYTHTYAHTGVLYCVRLCLHILLSQCLQTNWLGDKALWPGIRPAPPILHSPSSLLLSFCPFLLFSQPLSLHLPLTPLLSKASFCLWIWTLHIPKEQGIWWTITCLTLERRHFPSFSRNTNVLFECVCEHISQTISGSFRTDVLSSFCSSSFF